MPSCHLPINSVKAVTRAFLMRRQITYTDEDAQSKSAD
jgi:hypothetical protein